MSTRFQPGEPAPWFKVLATTGKPFHFDTAAGRYLVLCFFGSAAWDQSQPILHDCLHKLRSYFDDEHCAFFGISIDPEDETSKRVHAMLPGIRYFWDFEGEVSKRYGALGHEHAPSAEEQGSYHGFTLVLDPMLRVLAQIDHLHPAHHHQQLTALLEQIKVGQVLSPTHAPVLILPRVFEPEFCRELIGLYEANGGTDSGFMRQIGDKTVAVVNHDFKQRSDFSFDIQPELQDLREKIRSRIAKRLLPHIQKAFQFEVTHIERYVVSCYEAGKGHFRPHRDNTTLGTAHRRFACTLNLNAEEYEGGDLRFPEFGPATYRAPTGGAVVFSCSLLHEATPVTSGKRYAFLPFFYNSEDAKIREKNKQFIE